MLSKGASSNLFWVLGMTWPGIESRSPRPLANTQYSLMGSSRNNDLSAGQWLRIKRFQSSIPQLHLFSDKNPGKTYKPPIPPLWAILQKFLYRGFGIKWPTNVDIPLKQIIKTVRLYPSYIWACVCVCVYLNLSPLSLCLSLSLCIYICKFFYS